MSIWTYWDGTQEIVIPAPIDTVALPRISYKIVQIKAGTTKASKAVHVAGPDIPALFIGDTTFPGNDTYIGGE